MGTAEPFRMCVQQEIKYAEHSMDRGSDTHEGKQCSMVCGIKGSDIVLGG